MATILGPVTDFYPIFMILTGISGLFMGWDRVWKDDEEESKRLQLVGVISGIVLNVIIILAIYNRQEITKYTILFSLFFGISLYAKAFRKIPIAFAVSAILGLILAYFTIQAREDADSDIANIPLRWFILGIAIAVGIIFLISFIQEQAMDIMLRVLSWGALVIILGILMVLQGITLLLEIPNAGGILDYLPG